MPPVRTLKFLALFAALASPAQQGCAVTIRIDYSIDDAGNKFFGVNNPQGASGATAARAALQAAANFYSEILDDTLSAIVPPQHMWGLEATVMLPLQTGGVVHACRPLFPADVAGWLAELPRRRVLVTTPLHIRACVEDSVELPRLDLVLSAAAPLARGLAAAAEARFGARVVEIYGCTEAGMLASRRTARTETWRTLRGVRVTAARGGWAFEGGHIEGLAPSNDVLEVLGRREFRLAGRLADVVNVAGKRASLADLNRKLAEIPGVKDGVFRTREAESGKVARLMAFVVAPGLSESQILEALRCSIDPVFLPRPLVKVPALPRAPTGKLPLDALRELEASACDR